MKTNFPFLKDKSAINEIRKHKWLESEKAGCEIGFASAAIDWINKYSQQWLSYHMSQSRRHDITTEKRRHRRLHVRIPLNLVINKKNIKCHTEDISFMGFSCAVNENVKTHTITKVDIRFAEDNRPLPKGRFRFNSCIARVSDSHRHKTSSGKMIFLPFSEGLKQHLLKCTDWLN